MITAPLTGDDNPVAGYALHTRRSSGQAAVDELLDEQGGVRLASRNLGSSIALMGPAGLIQRRAEARRLAEDDGVTYGFADAHHPANRWPVDPLPVMLDAAEWTRLEAGLVQRALLLDLILADLYGPRRLLGKGLLPTAAILGHGDYLRAAHGIRLPGPRQLFLTATDLGRDSDGQWKVLADRTQAPSGAGYAMENRRIVSRVMPALHRDTGLARLRDFFNVMRAALQDIAPSTGEVSRVVVLTPGAGTETAFDQSFLATLLGYPLVTGDDLVVQDGRVWMRGLARREPVDVVLRRLDAAYADPLDLRADSRLGVAGLLDAARRRQVSIVNPLGSGVLENPALGSYLPALCEALLGEPLRLSAPQTWWCGDPAQLRTVQARFAGLVMRPLSRRSDASSQVVAELTRAQQRDLAARIAAEPAAWCAQEPVILSTAPVVVDSGLQPRSLVLRTFAVSRGGTYHVMSGGLARVAGAADTRMITNSRGAVTKDVWVPARDTVSLSETPADLASRPAGRSTLGVAPSLAPRVAEDLFWLGRYAERAEGAARLLRVADDLAEDWSRHPGTAGAQAMQVALDVLRRDTLSAGDPGAPQAELLRHTIDAETPGTLAFAVRRTMESAHAVRDQLSLDTWLVVGSLERVLGELAALAGRAAPGHEPALRPTLARVLEGLLALAGLSAESMIRDTAYLFLDAGRRIERALHILGVLHGTFVQVHAAPTEQMVVEAALIVGDSIITYRRRAAPGQLETSAPAAAAGALDLLLLDVTNPRSVAYQLGQLTDALGALPAPDEGATRGIGELHAVLRRTRMILGQASLAQWCATESGGRRPVLAEHLDELTGNLRTLSVLIENVYFRYPAPLRRLPSYPGQSR